MNLEAIIQSKVGQKEKDKYNILMYRYGIWKSGMKNLFNGETDIENRLMDVGRGEERVRCMERVTWKLTLPCVK